MFDKKYITKGISSEVPFYLQNLMWLMIDSMEVEKQDYLQVFELKKIEICGKIFQQIIHRQEQPEYQKEIAIPLDVDKVVENKIFVIDDETHCTMLLAEEY